MASTFWERIGGFGEGAGDQFDLEVFVDTLLLHGQDKITTTAAKTALALTADQQDEFDLFINERRPGDPVARQTWPFLLRAMARAARNGAPSFNSVEDLQTAVGYNFGT